MVRLEHGFECGGFAGAPQQEAAMRKAGRPADGAAGQRHQPGGVHGKDGTDDDQVVAAQAGIEEWEPLRLTYVGLDQDLDNDPPVNLSLEQAVFEEYGVPASSKKAYELDYLIRPALGGADSIQNLWPQPYSSAWNARVRDHLADHLHELVCQGKLQLATAQSDIASNWVAAHKRYFKPQPSQSTAASVD